MGCVAGDAEKIFATHDVTNDDILTTKISEAINLLFLIYLFHLYAVCDPIHPPLFSFVDV